MNIFGNRSIAVVVTRLAASAAVMLVLGLGLWN